MDEPILLMLSYIYTFSHFQPSKPLCTVFFISVRQRYIQIFGSNERRAKIGTMYYTLSLVFNIAKLECLLFSFAIILVYVSLCSN